MLDMDGMTCTVKKRRSARPNTRELYLSVGDERARDKQKREKSEEAKEVVRKHTRKNFTILTKSKLV